MPHQPIQRLQLTPVTEGYLNLTVFVPEYLVYLPFCSCYSSASLWQIVHIFAENLSTNVLSRLLQVQTKALDSSILQ